MTNDIQITKFFDRNDYRTHVYIIVAIEEENKLTSLLVETYSKRIIRTILPALKEEYNFLIVANGKKAWKDITALNNGPIPAGYIPCTEEEFFHPTKKSTPEKEAQTRAPGVYSITDKAKKRRRALNAMVKSTGVDGTIAFLDQVLIDTPKTSHTSPFITKKINEDKEFVLSFTPKTYETGNIPGAEDSDNEEEL